MPLYPSKVLQARERAPTLCSSTVLYMGLTFESLKELGTRHPSFLVPLNPARSVCSHDKVDHSRNGDGELRLGEG
jgi:hypothetical protein